MGKAAFWGEERDHLHHAARPPAIGRREAWSIKKEGRPYTRGLGVGRSGWGARPGPGQCPLGPQHEASWEGTEFVNGEVKDRNLDTYTPLRIGDGDVP
jgi:hypothetical protein